MKHRMIVAILGLGLGAMGGCDKDSSKEPNKSGGGAAQPNNAPAPAAAISVSAADLVAEAAKDAAAVKTKYANKTLLVEGTIKETATGDSVSVTLSAPGSKWVVVCNVPSPAVESVKPLKKDQVVKMRGDFMNASKLLEEVSLGGCEVVK